MMLTCPHCGGTLSEVRLSPRELDILRLVAEGQENKEIAVGLCISKQTVKNHLMAINRRLGAANRTQAAVLAIKQGLIG